MASRSRTARAITTDAPATPDPCVASRETLTGVLHAGDVRLTIKTSHASSWTVGIRPTAPGAPRFVTAVRGDTRATVDWAPPEHDGFRPDHRLHRDASPGGRTATVGADTWTASVTGLTNGVSYTFTVRATNVIGTGPASDPSNAVTPVALPSQTITFATISNKTMLQSPVVVNPTASSGLPVTLTHDDPVDLLRVRDVHLSVRRRDVLDHGQPARQRRLATGHPDHADVHGQPGQPVHHLRVDLRRRRSPSPP